MISWGFNSFLVFEVGYYNNISLELEVYNIFGALWVLSLNGRLKKLVFNESEEW